jgi:hypothetical protein
MSKELDINRKAYRQIFTVLLITMSILCSSCNNILDKISNVNDIQTGYISITIINNTNTPARTVLPTTPTIARHDLFFKAVNFDPDDISVEDWQSGDAVAVPAGTWTLTVIGYTDSAGTSDVLKGSTEITVTAGETVSASVTLKGIADEGTGTLAYDISVPGDMDISSVALKLTPLTGNGAEQNLVLTTSLSGTESLEAGQWRITVSILSDSNTQAIRNEIIIIYKNMITNIPTEVANFLNTDFAAPITIPESPDVPSLVASNGKLTLNWTAVEFATSYEVWYDTTNNTAYASLYTTVTDTRAIISGLTNGTLYYIWIKAKNSLGTSGFSPSAGGQAMNVMGSITVVVGNGQLSLSWDAVEGATNYSVYRDTSTTMPATASQTVNTNMATITGLSNGTVYYIWVKANGDGGSSSVSPVASGVPIGNTGTVTVTAGNASLDLSWAAVSGATSYNLFYSIGSSKPETANTTVNTNTATISGLTNGTTYYVWVQAKNSSGTGGVSERTSGVPVIPFGLYKTSVTPANKLGTQNLADSVTYINTYAVSGDSYYIVLGANESLNRTNISCSGRTVNVTIMSDGIERQISPISTTNNMIVVSDGITLVLSGNIIIQAASDEATAALISAKTLIMNDGVKITGYLTSYGAVLGVDDFTMNGGEISGNQGGGQSGVVQVLDTFTMNGGKINNNTRDKVIVIGDVNGTEGSFIMNGGEINSNEGHALYFCGGTMLITDGEIAYNEMSALTTNTSGMTGTLTSTISMEGGSIHDNSGAGVDLRNNSTFTMSGGSIYNNTNNAYMANGGGISGGTITMTGGSIYGNTVSGDYASGGGGIGAAYITIGGDAKIYNNKVTSEDCLGGGGGIYAYGTFTMNGGEIYDNTANSGSGWGGGVYFAGSSFIMNGGIIRGNSALTGGGVHIVRSLTSPTSPQHFEKNAGAIIYGSDANNQLPNIASGSTGGDAICVFTGTITKKRNTTIDNEVLGFDYDSENTTWTGTWE